jgi:hypothetical protein
MKCFYSTFAPEYCQKAFLSACAVWRNRTAQKHYETPLFKRDVEEFFSYIREYSGMDDLFFKSDAV